jgi:cation:H+ antiporter
MIVQVLIILGAAAGIWLFSDMLSKGTDALGKRFRIDPGVRGATLDAVASSFPEFCTVIIALFAGAFDAGVGTIAGSALYNILVIPAVSVLVGGPLAIQKQVVRRDGFLYVAVVAALIAVIWLGPEVVEGTKTSHAISPWAGAGAIVVYLGYVVVLVRQARKAAGKSEPAKQEGSGEEKGTPFNPYKTGVFVLVGIVGIGVATHFLVHASLGLFKIIGLSEAIAGVTVLAAATSLPDTLLSVFAVRRGDADGAVSNAFGSNSFDILICLGLPILVTGGVLVDWQGSWPMLAFLFASTIVSVVFLLTDWQLTRREAVVMGATYLLFMGLAFGGVF